MKDDLTVAIKNAFLNHKKSQNFNTEDALVEVSHVETLGVGQKWVHRGHLEAVSATYMNL